MSEIDPNGEYFISGGDYVGEKPPGEWPFPQPGTPEGDEWLAATKASIAAGPEGKGAGGSLTERGLFDDPEELALVLELARKSLLQGPPSDLSKELPQDN